MNASVAIQSLPKAANDEELIRIVDQVIDYIKSTGLNYYVGPFETTIEGDYDQLMDIVKECQHIAVRAGAPSVAAYIKVSYHPEGDVLTIEKKVTKHHQYAVVCFSHSRHPYPVAAFCIPWSGGGIYAAFTGPGGRGVYKGIPGPYGECQDYTGRGRDGTFFGNCHGLWGGRADGPV